MCDPVSAGIATAVGAAASLAGTFMASSAAKQNQAAIAAQNQATQLAQNQAFTQRNLAGITQVGAQTAASQEMLSGREQAANRMRDLQQSASDRFAETINAQNQQAESLRGTGDTAAQELLQQTNAQALTDAQTQRQRETEALLESSYRPEGPGPTDPNNATARDPVQGGALARRTAEAATNIRNYGSKLATLGSYGAPLEQTGLAIQENKFGIMPAQTAESILRSGSQTRLLPASTAYKSAGTLGEAQDIIAQSRGQGALAGAGLSYGNAVDLANLQQSNLTTEAANRARQAQSDAEAKKAQAGIISGIGNLALYGGGRYGGGSSISSGLSNLFYPGEVFNAAGNDTIPNPNYIFGALR